ncbi:MAG TPA: nuclear transport factor 2 family protein [Candidatus Acidoferrales bacterium]|nr:nuclear transport factor 2 family protein [Candidatus Acidoferrales bacterium]
MKITSVLIVVVAISMSSALFLGRPKVSAAGTPSPESRVSKTSDASLEQQIVAKEREGLDALKAGNLERFANLTADDGVFVDAQGPASKATVVKNVAGFTLSEYSMENIQFVPISANSGLITYKIYEKGASHGKEFAAQAYVSSIWMERGSEWVCLFSQETAVRLPAK